MNRFGLALVLSGLLATWSFAVSPDPKELAVSSEDVFKSRLLIRQLASEDYGEREEAHRALARMGRLARPALAEAAATDPSAEVRSRAARLLPKAEAEELKARIETFLADAEGQYVHDLPSWKLFRTLIGSDKPSQSLFVEMLKSPGNLDLLVALEHSENEAGRAIADRRMTIYMNINPHAFGRPLGVKPIASQPASLADVATLVFAEIVVDAKHIPRSAFFGQVSAATFLQQAASNTAANGGGGLPGEAYRRLLSQWFETRVHPEDLSNYNVINVANQFRKFPETTDLLRRVVTTDGVVSYQKSQAVMYLIQRNGKDEKSFLHALVVADKDRTASGNPAAIAVGSGLSGVADHATILKRHSIATGIVAQVWLGNGNNNATCQLRDYALAILIIQSGQNLTDFGYSFPPGNGQNQNQIGYPNYAFTDDKTRTSEDKREAAIARYRVWETELNPPGVKPNPFRQAGQVMLPDLNNGLRTKW